MGGDRDTQAPLFTVKDAQKALSTFAIFAVACIIVVFLHSILLKGKSFLEALSSITSSVRGITGVSTLLTLIVEGFDIMFGRTRNTLKREKELIDRGERRLYKRVSRWNA